MPLYLCATPIGNLSDISARCLEILSSVDLIAAEDTRRTLTLLNHFNISKPLTSYFEHNKAQKGEYLVSLLKEGKSIALVSDAGTPAISDPGEDLVKLCIQNGIRVESIPGPVACINALVLSGFSTQRFCFEGFLSMNKRSRKEHLESLKDERRTMLFHEAPHKLKYTLNDMIEYFGPNRRIALVRELTKIHEEVIHTTLQGAIELYTEQSPKGEYVVVVEGLPDSEAKLKSQWWDNLDICEHVSEYINQGFTDKEAIKKAALDRQIPKREVYNSYHKK